MSNFSQPDKSEGFAPRNHPEWLGRLFLIYPNEITTKVFNPQDGPKELVNSDVVILDLVDPQTGQPTVLAGASIGGAGLVPQIKRRVGGMVLGRLSKSAPQGQKDGAYFLAEFSPQDEVLAGAYVASHPREQFAQPQAQQAPPQSYPGAALPDPWAGTGQYQQPTPAVPQPAPAAPVADPAYGQLVAFLQSKGLNPANPQGQLLDAVTVRNLAATFPDAPKV